MVAARPGGPPKCLAFYAFLQLAACFFFSLQAEPGPFSLQLCPKVLPLDDDLTTDISNHISVSGDVV